MKKREEIYGEKPSNKLVSIVIVTIVIILCIFFSIQTKEIKAQNSESEIQIQELQAEIESEEARTEELNEYSKYVNTKQFVEDIARSKLGLIYSNEIIFKADEQ